MIAFVSCPTHLPLRRTSDVVQSALLENAGKGRQCRRREPDDPLIFDKRDCMRDHLK